MEALDVLKDWGGWLAAGVVGWWSLRDGRIDERIEIVVGPGAIHETLERIEKKVDGLDVKLDGIAERTARLEGATGPLPAEFGERARLKP